MQIAITRQLTGAIAMCELTHLARTPINVERAQAQHAEYERALGDAGCAVMRLTAADTLPDAVFVEDTAVVLDEVAVITRPGAESRRLETTGVAAALARFRPIATIRAPGTLDGGDVLRIGKRILVGASLRSNEYGIEQLRGFVEPFGYTVESVLFRGCLHLKSAVTLVAPDVALYNPAWVQAGVLGHVQVIEVDPSEPASANALLVGDTIIFPSEHAGTMSRLASMGLELMPVPASELAKAEGGVTCCCLLVDEVV